MVLSLILSFHRTVMSVVFSHVTVFELQQRLIHLKRLSRVVCFRAHSGGTSVEPVEVIKIVTKAFIAKKEGSGKGLP